MSGFLSGPYGVVVGFALTCLSGFWLSRLGRPYGPLVFNVHKFIAIGAVVITALAVRNPARYTGPDPGVVMLATIVAASAVVALFTTGGLLGAGKTAAVLLRVHQVAPWVASVCATAAAYLMAAHRGV